MLTTLGVLVQDTHDDRLAGANTLAGQIVVSSFVLAAIAAIIGAGVMVGAHYSRQNRIKAGALTFVPRVAFGVAIIAGAVGGVAYGASGYGSTGLMPAQSRSVTVDLTRNPPKSTCKKTEQVRVDQLSDRNGMTQQAKDKLSPLFDVSVLDQYASASGVPAKVTATWTPKGPDCTSSNTTADPCTQIEVLLDWPGSNADIPSKTLKLDPPNKSACMSK